MAARRVQRGSHRPLIWRSFVIRPQRTRRLLPSLGCPSRAFCAVIPMRNRPGPASQDDLGEVNAKRGVFLHLLEELADVALGSTWLMIVSSTAS